MQPGFVFCPLLLIAALLGGCATHTAVTPARDVAGGPEVAPMIAVQAYRGDAAFFVKYRQGDEIRFSGGNWRDRLLLVDDPVSTDYAVPTMLPMQYHQAEPWSDLPANAVSIPVLGIEVWQQLRERLLRSIVPTDGSGVVVDFESSEYFLYFDEMDRMRAGRSADKPADRPVRENLRFDEMLRRGRPLLDDFLREQGIEYDEFVINTGDSGLYSLPFLYFNRNRHLLVFIRNPPVQALATASVPGLKGGQAFGHLLQSHLVNLVQRPVSSLYRLFFVVTDSAVETVSLGWTTALSEQVVPALADAPPMDLQQWEAQLDDLGSRPASSGSLDLLVDGEAFFTRLIDRIGAARESVKMQAYIFDNDDYALRIGERLKQRSNEDIEVKILLDGMGTISGTMAEADSLPAGHMPPPSVRYYLESDSRIKVRQKANPWFTGDHVKATLIDRQFAFVGGMNIGREYRYDWHDLMMELQGPVVDLIDREFQLAWGHAGVLGDIGYVIAKARKQHRRSTPGEYPMRVLLTEPGNYEIYRAQLQAIRQSQRYIYIQNAYFTDDSLLRELVLARRRGVDVRIVMPLETDHGPVTRSNVLAANLMLKHGIRVYLYPGFSHVKAAVYDGWVIAGSANFDRWSLRLNRELNLASSAPEVTAQFLERLFEPDFRLSPELLEPIPERWVDHLVEIIGDYVY